MKKISVLLISLILLGFIHPHYLSVTDLKFNKKENRLQGYTKIFTHDFENSLKKIHKKPVDLINPTDSTATRKMLEDYLQSHLLLQVNGKKLSYRVIGFENENESVFIYIESASCARPNIIAAQNSLLFESYREQTNIMHLEVEGVRKSLKVTNPSKELTFEFKK